ncbi:Mycothiol maleylpyruvate isomerase N-terminal domain-containing protein [Frankineae bacterium MT45]|nr:Mycothiol maleylpyruvate isomerase N-terminal domain-containing protein [Frankineae bacterium MT45]
MMERSVEAEEFFTTVDAVPPQAVSACAGWTTHEVAAHVAGIAAEVTRHLKPYLAGDPVPETRSFEEREAPLQQLEHSALLRRLDAEDERMRSIVDDVLESDPDAVIPWTGRRMAVAKFIPHLRNEYALHRWDIAGDDEVSGRLLGDLDLVAHSVGELGRILLVAGRQHDPDAASDFNIRLRTPGQPDLRVVVEAGHAALVWGDDADDGSDDAPALEIDAGARHLFIWGRRPDHRGRLLSQLHQPELARLQALLSGY